MVARAQEENADSVAVSGGVLCDVLNPKVIVFYLTFSTTLTTPGNL